MEVSASHFTFVSLLLIISLVAMLARRTRVPYTVAVALSIPTAIQERDQILVMTFGVVLFSLVVQGLTMRPLLRLLRLVQPLPEQLEYEYTRGRLVATRAATDTLQRMQQEGLVSRRPHTAHSPRGMTLWARSSRRTWQAFRQHLAHWPRKNWLPLTANACWWPRAPCRISSGRV